jgi:membrane-associated phospholipid phosphatase
MTDLSSTTWASITNFGGSAVMLPTALAIAAWRSLDRSWRYALLWLALVGGGGLLVGATKIAFIGWGVGIRPLDFTGISGHAMLASAVYPVLCFIALNTASAQLRAAGVTAGMLFGLLVGVSRYPLRAHSASEIVAGCALGACIALLYIRLDRPPPGPRMDSRLVAVGAALLVMSLHGFHLPTQQWITQMALGLSGHKRPYIRARWLREPAASPGCATRERCADAPVLASDIAATGARCG